MRSWSSGGEGIYSLPLYPGSIFFVHACPPVVSYLSTELTKCSVDPEISSGARKLTRIPRVIKKKKSNSIDYQLIIIIIRNIYRTIT